MRRKGKVRPQVPQAGTKDLKEESVPSRQLSAATRVTEALQSLSPSPVHKGNAPNKSATSPRQKKHSLATEVVGSNGASIQMTGIVLAVV